MEVDEEVPPPPPPPPRVAAGEADDDAVRGEVGGGQKGEGKEEDIEGLEAAGVGEEAGEEEGALHGLVLQVTKIASSDAAVKVQMVVAGRVLEGALFQEFKSGDEGANVAWQWLNSGIHFVYFYYLGLFLVYLVQFSANVAWQWLNSGIFLYFYFCQFSFLLVLHGCGSILVRQKEKKGGKGGLQKRKKRGERG